MAKGDKPNWQASTVVEYGSEGKSRWTNLGVGFDGKESITVLIDAVPVNGKIVLTPYKEKPKQETVA